MGSMDKNNFLIKGFLKSPNHPSMEVRMANAESELADFKSDLLSIYTPEELDRMTPYELLNARLQSEGIQGYTGDVMRWVIQVIGLGLEDHELRKLGL